MKRFIYIFIIALQGSISFAQTPFDSFAPEISRPMLDIDFIRARDAYHAQQAITTDTILYFVDITNGNIIASVPLTDELRKWLSVDPLSDKYPNISPYAYCAWNPINKIDPDGRDWYAAEEGSAVFWKNSNDASINIDGTTYNNIGENYNHIVGNTTYGYHQNELYSISADVMSEKNFISQSSRGEKWDDETLAKFACQKACDAMLSSAGYKSAAPSNDFVIVENINGTGSAGAANSNAERAIRKMTDNLFAGFPSKVSVDHRPGTGGHADKIGDHFVVIRGVTEYLSKGNVIGAEYRFFDPGTQWPQKGIAGTLRFQDWRLVGFAPYGSQRPYTVSSIRLCK